MYLIAQCQEEQKYGDANVIGDRCILDCLAYAKWRSRQFDDGPRRYEALVRRFEAEIGERVSVYRRSLMVLVRPWDRVNGTENTDDNVRLTMSRKQCDELNDIFVGLYEAFDIAFVDLEDVDRGRRVAKIKAALSKAHVGWAKVPLNNSLIKHYDDSRKNSRKEWKKRGKNKKSQKTSHPAPTAPPSSPTRISFYLQDQNEAIRTIKIFERHLELQYTPYKGPEKSRFAEKFDPEVERLVFVHFGSNVDEKFAFDVVFNGIKINGQLYSFVGPSSAAGLKDRKAVFWPGDSNAVEELLRLCGDFDKVETVSKRLARKALIFTDVFSTGICIDGDI